VTEELKRNPVRRSLKMVQRNAELFSPPIFWTVLHPAELAAKNLSA
jgi:hypothetical protein